MTTMSRLECLSPGNERSSEESLTSLLGGLSKILYNIFHGNVNLVKQATLGHALTLIYVIYSHYNHCIIKSNNILVKNLELLLTK